VHLKYHIDEQKQSSSRYSRELRSDPRELRSDPQRSLAGGTQTVDRTDDRLEGSG
jgi:hypothetical protein